MTLATRPVDSAQWAKVQVDSMLARITAAEPIPAPLPALDMTDVTSRAASVLSAGKDDGLPQLTAVGQHAGEVVAQADLPAFLSWALRLAEVRVQTDASGIRARGVAGGVVWNLTTDAPTPVVEPVTEDLPVHAVVQAEIVPELPGGAK